MIAGRTFRPKHYAIFAIILCVIALAALPSIYYAQTQGVCLKAGRVLSEEELRKAVLADIINDDIKIAFHDNWEGGHDRRWVGINSPAHETDLEKIIDASYNNGKSIEENFGLRVLVKGRNNRTYETFTRDQVFEPFILMIYDVTSGGEAIAFISSNIWEIPFKDLNAEQREAEKRIITKYKRLLGYGNHYFYFYEYTFSFDRSCCDNRGQEYKDYLEDKKESYDLVKNSLKQRAAIPSYIPPVVAAVSNCGTLLMAKKNGIHWLNSRDIENEEWP
jgi:hypothetical protein